MTRYEQATASSQNLTYNRAKERATIYRKGKRGGMGACFTHVGGRSCCLKSQWCSRSMSKNRKHSHRQGSQVWLMRGVKLGPDTRHNPRGTRGGGVWVCFFKKKCNLLSAEIGNEGAMGHCTLHSLHHAYACRLSQAHVQGSEDARRGGTGILQQFALTQ